MKFFIIACLVSMAYAGMPFIGMGYGHGLGGIAYGMHSPAGLGGNGFGHMGPYSPMPVQEVKYFPVPHPVPYSVPVGVDAPYKVGVDQPYKVMIDKPVPTPYLAKVIQPIINKQVVHSSAILTHGYHK